MPYKDKAKQREVQARWARENPQNRQRHTQKRQQIVIKAKDKPCVACGIKYHYAAMDLHHLDPSLKKDSIGNLTKAGKLEEIREEIEKCVVLCANCHRLFHAGEITLL